MSAKKGLTVGAHHFGINPLSPNSDQHEFSPKDIHTLSREMVLRINKTITKEKMPLSFTNSLYFNSLWKCIESSLENLYVGIGA